jgi:hypothetical protein
VQDGRPFLLGLIDVEELRKEQEEKRRLNKKPVAVEANAYEYDASSLGVNAESLGRFCPQLAPV